MAKIILECEDKNLPIILNILENLKSGLLKDISVNKIDNPNKSIKPVSSSLGEQNQKRYLSKDKYKQKLNKIQHKDELGKQSTSTGKYLSADDFKNKNNKGK